MPREFNFHDSLHVLQRSAERNIDTALVYETVKTGAVTHTGMKGRLGGLKVLYKKRHDRRLIVVVAEVRGSECYLLTAYEGS